MFPMTIAEAIQARHSVRTYLDKPLEAAAVAALQAEIDACNAEGNLRCQLVTGEPEAFSGFMAHYGKFSGVHNYIALVGKEAPDLDERVGYYGERIVLTAQTLGLNTCWVALTLRRGAVRRRCTQPGERLACTLALGYGATQGVPHTSKPLEALYQSAQPIPDWFRRGMEAAALAPTAVNQQKFCLTLQGSTVSAQSLSTFFGEIDLGIVKYHFEVGAGRENFTWA